MARKKKKGRKRQGIVSNLTSAFAWLIALAPVLIRLPELSRTNGFWNFSVLVTEAYTGYNFQSRTFDARRLAQGWAPLIGGIAFKKATSYLARRARVAF